MHSILQNHWAVLDAVCWLLAKNVATVVWRSAQYNRQFFC